MASGATELVTAYNVEAYAGDQWTTIARFDTPDQARRAMAVLRERRPEAQVRLAIISSLRRPNSDVATIVAEARPPMPEPPPAAPDGHAPEGSFDVPPDTDHLADGRQLPSGTRPSAPLTKPKRLGPASGATDLRSGVMARRMGLGRRHTALGGVSVLGLAAAVFVVGLQTDHPWAVDMRDTALGLFDDGERGSISRSLAEDVEQALAGIAGDTAGGLEQPSVPRSVAEDTAIALETASSEPGLLAGQWALSPETCHRDAVAFLSGMEVRIDGAGRPAARDVAAYAPAADTPAATVRYQDGASARYLRNEDGTLELVWLTIANITITPGLTAPLYPCTQTSPADDADPVATVVPGANTMQAMRNQNSPATGFSAAVAFGDVAAALGYIDAGVAADTMLPDRDGLTALDWAIVGRNRMVVAGLLDAMPATGRDSEAIGEGDADEAAVAHPLDRLGAGGLTPLILAVLVDDRAMVELLLAHGADADFTDAEGFTALAHATANDRADLVALLEPLTGAVEPSPDTPAEPLPMPMAGQAADEAAELESGGTDDDEEIGSGL